MQGMRWIAVAFGATALLAIAAGAGFAGAASAAAVVTIDYSTSSSSDPGEPLIDECRPDLTVTSFFGTGEIRVETVETAVGFHFEMTEVGTARIEWSDGSYSLIKVKDHFSFNAGNGTADGRLHEPARGLGQDLHRRGRVPIWEPAPSSRALHDHRWRSPGRLRPFPLQLLRRLLSSSGERGQTSGAILVQQPRVVHVDSLNG